MKPRMMKPRILSGLLAVLFVVGSGVRFEASAQSAAAAATPRDGIPTMSLEHVARQGFYFAGGTYRGALGNDNEPTMGGAMYVEVMVPREIRSPYPIVFLHGAGQTAVDWLQTPDGRPGWAYNFLEMGYVVYMQDFPARGRSQYVPGVDGTPGNLNLNIRTAPNLEEIFTASAVRADFPQASRHTAWPGTGLMGDPIFDDFTKTQVQFLTGPRQASMTVEANVALLDAIGSPVILLTHSQGGAFGWLIADARPDLVRAIITAEPAAPPIRGVDTSAVEYRDGGGLSWGVSGSFITYDPLAAEASELQTELVPTDEPEKVGCYLQQEPARQLVNLRDIPVLFLVGEGSYHRIFDHCLARWLNQAGVQTQYVEMEDVGLRGNGHMMMLEENSDEIARYMGEWLSETVGSDNAPVSQAMPPASIPTFSTEHFASKGFFYAGGEYWGEPGREIMRGAMYTEVWVPRQIRSPYPVIVFHSNGNTGVTFQQTPDGRSGWAYRLVEEGYVVYIIDYPARGRSAYVPVPGPDGETPIDGNLGIRTAIGLEQIWTNPRERGNFPLMMNHTQWPGAGKIGDPIFDNFMKTQVQFAGATGALSRPAMVALLDKIATPVILLTHSQGGGMGFDITEQRPELVRAIVALEPGGPQFGGADTANVEPRDRNPNSWGLTTNPYTYDPPASSPEEIEVYLEETSERPDEVRCWMQVEPARRLVNFQDIPVLSPTADGTYHRVYDTCIPRFLQQAGVPAELVRLEEVGISGNSHIMMLEKNSDDIIRFIMDWIDERVLSAETEGGQTAAR